MTFEYVKTLMLRNDTNKELDEDEVFSGDEDFADRYLKPYSWFNNLASINASYKTNRELEIVRRRLDRKQRLVDNAVRPRAYIINPQKSRLYNYWYMIVMMAAIFNSIWTPMAISFEYIMKLNQDSSGLVHKMDISADLIFLLDIIIHFFTSYSDQNIGAQVTQPKLIAIYYMKGEFLFDFLATVPLKRLVSILGI